jgi:hypothetical protein
MTMYIDTKHHWFIDGSRRVYIPYPRAKVAVGCSNGDPDYCLRVTDIDTNWHSTFWKSSDEAELSVIINLLRTQGIQVDGGDVH